jgi:hypothetical protein
MARPGLSIDFDLGSDLAAGHLRFRMVSSRLSLLGCPSHPITIAIPRGVPSRSLGVEFVR